MRLWSRYLGLPALLLVILGASPGVCLRIQEVTFPSHVILGQMVTLICEYSVGEAEAVDSIKWYKDGREFYRLLPNSRNVHEKVIVFEQEGIDIDRQKSGLLKVGMHQLVLLNVSLNTTGNFQCQLTESDLPFHTEQMEKPLKVIIPPDGGPTITGLQAEYNVGETITAYCISRASYPYTHLDFFINDEPVGRSHIDRPAPEPLHKDSIFTTSTLTLTYPVKARVSTITATSDELSVKCTAKIGNAYWRSVVLKTSIKRQGWTLESKSSGASGGRPSERLPMVLSSLLALLVLMGFNGN